MTLNPRRDSVFVLTLWVGYVWFLHYGPGFIPANESIRLYAAQAMVDHQSLSLDPVLASHSVRNVDQAEFRGHAYLDKAPGLSLLAVPVYAAASRLGMSGDREHIPDYLRLLTALLVALPAAFGCLAVQRTLTALGTSEAGSWAAALILGLCSPYAIYATLFFGHGAAAALAAGLLWASIARRAGTAGVLVGAMVLVETQTAVLAMVLAIPVLRGGPRNLVRFALGAAPFALIQAGLNLAIFGSPLEFAYAHKSSAAFQAVHGHGLLGIGLPSLEALVGLSFGPARGLFLISPVLLLALWGLRNRAAWIPLAAFGAHTLVMAGFSDWMAGDAWGPRHLVPALPALAVAVGLGLDSLGSRLRDATAVLAGASAVGAWLPIATFPYALQAFPVPLAQLGLSLAGAGHFAPTLLGTGWLVAAVGIAWAVCVPAVVVLGPKVLVSRWTLFAAVGLAVFVAALSWVPAPEGGAERARIFVDCLMDNEDAAGERCRASGQDFDPRRCMCR